ncbi:MAG: KpsF/GutQ family sugar-phosphate isomerase [candidate division KSB1 bacterium]|nr:KpsF/GutQ family sugar-phosphate isomerase [candidate division KSB1 bacterium]MDZ7345557.1 KpsF/GutQ family sugar-phosphate isomerase [candidate division KSB1 bacterium]
MSMQKPISGPFPPLQNKNVIIECARRVLRIESEAVAALIPRIDESFERAVRTILNCKGRVIVTGIGKSGLIGKKIAATFSSTGTPAFFLHPADAVHGDVGMVTPDDVVICLSKSGNTDEISALIPILKRIGVPIITLTGNLRSSLATRSDIVIDVGVAGEACPNDLAPTASTTAMLAMGDALAVALLEQRDFDSEDFAFLHPAGSLGRRLQKIDDIMFTGSYLPVVSKDARMTEVISEITRKRFGGTCVVDENGKLAGIITDGDLRRLLQKPCDLTSMKALEVMNPNPKTARCGSTALSAFQIMEQHNILQLIIVDDENRPVGMVHLHDLLEAGMGAFK